MLPDVRSLDMDLMAGSWCDLGERLSCYDGSKT